MQIFFVIWKSPFFTHECCTAAFVSLCDHSHIPIALTLATRCVKTKTNISVRFVGVIRFKYTSFYNRFQSFQSLFASLSSFVSIAVRIYFNLLQNTGAKSFCIWNFLSAGFIGIRESPSWAPLFLLGTCFIQGVIMKFEGVIIDLVKKINYRKEVCLCELHELNLQLVEFPKISSSIQNYEAKL